MIHTELQTIDGESLIVLITRPNAANGFGIRYRRYTDISTGLTGIEHRRPDADATRLSISYNAILKDADWQTWRDLVGQMDGRRVAIPLWPDVLPFSEWSTRVHRGQKSIGWDTGFESIAIGTDTSPPEREFIAPLVIGRLQHEEHEVLTGGAASVLIELVEDRPYAWRITPAGTDGAWNWAPDWVGDRTEETMDFLRLDTLGRGSEQMTEGDPAVRITQKAQFRLKREAFKQFIAFWHARKGSYEAFAAPSPWQPGSETPFAPHFFDDLDGKGLLRFDSDELKTKWATNSLIEFTCSFRQVIQAAGEQEHPAFGFLYRFFRTDDDSLTERVTDREAPITVGGHTWTPANIEHKELRQSLKVQNENCEITVAIDDIALLMGVARHEVEAPLWVEVLEYNASTGTANSLFMGQVTKTRAKGKKITLHTSLFGGILARQAPRFLLSRTCNFSVFDGACARAGLNKDDYKATGKFASQTADYLLILNDVVLPSTYTTWTEEAKLRGEVIGTNLARGNDFVRFGIDRVFDGNTSTFWDASGNLFSSQYAPGAWVGLDTGEPHRVTKIRFHPRTGYPERMVGGLIQGSNDLSSWTTLHTISVSPGEGWTEISVSDDTLFRYVRYYNNTAIAGNSNIAELEFYGNRTITEYYANGWIETGSGINRQKRPVVRAAYYQDEDVMHLALLRPLRTDIVDAEQEVKFWPGCDGSFSACRDKFGNQTIYGGLPFVPAYLEEKVGRNDVKGK